VTPDAYCREIEAYLTRKNDGHLIRIVGPSFDRVCGWAERGVPIKVAFQGIDRYFERYYARGPRRRPVFVDHCENDVLEAFDAWRRAVGVFTADRGDAGEGAPARRRESLAAGIERAMARLTSLRAGEAPPVPDEALEEAVRALDALLAPARGARGDARDEVLAALAAIEARLVAAALAALAPGEAGAVASQAEADLAPYRDRMTPDAWQQAVEAATAQAVRLRLRLPDLTEP
jgi:hypothetical protein